MRLRITVTLTVLIGAAACSRREASPPPASGSQFVDKGPFTITLPGSWNEDASGDEDRWIFTRVDGKATLTVSGMSDPQRRSGRELAELIGRIVRIRRQAELEVSKQGTQLEPVVVAHEGGAVVARTWPASLRLQGKPQRW